MSKTDDSTDVERSGNRPAGHEQWTLWAPEKKTATVFDTRADAEDRQEELDGLLDTELYGPDESPEALYHGDDAVTVKGVDSDEPNTVPCAACDGLVTIDDATFGPQNEPYHAACDGDEREGDETDTEGEPVDADIVEHSDDTTEELHQQNLAHDMAAARSMQDPLSTLPAWMITEVSYSDRGDTTTTVNKRGCQVIASYLNLEYETTATTRASDTDFAYAEFRCVVEKPDGRTFTGHGTAKADGDDQNESDGWKLDMLAETRAFKRAVKGATGGGIEAFAREQDAD